MSSAQQSTGRIKITPKQAMGLLGPYIKSRILEQIKAVFVIVTYLLLFQTLVLGIPIAQAMAIAIGLSMVIVGLAFFMEGLLLGIMPLGETIGVRLPQKAKLPVIMIFSFILGMGATFAEPAVGILKAAGYSVKAWDAPILFLLLNRCSQQLVYAVGVGVGLAVVVGMLRFMYSWSLKPLLYIIMPVALGFSLWAVFEPNMIYLTGLAWDCGGVTTGPVTVPLVLALGIGICRVVGGGGSGASGFGVVTLASALPVLTVMGLGLPYLGSVPKPMAQTEFCSQQNRAKAQFLFTDAENMTGYVLNNASPEAQIAYFGGSSDSMLSYLRTLSGDAKAQAKVFGPPPDAFFRWAATAGTPEQKGAVFGDGAEAIDKMQKYSTQGPAVIDFADVAKRNSIAALQAILPLCCFLIFMLFVVVRDKLPRPDEMLVGIFFGVIGMTGFNIGIELGLASMGAQVGAKLPSSFKAIPLPEQSTSIANFDTTVVQTAMDAQGEKHRFFFSQKGKQVFTLPFESKHFDAFTRRYFYTPLRGPLFGSEGSLTGIIVVLLFAFVMGYGATLAEPALNALGITVEELTVGTFKKALLMQAVAIGVGLGMCFGMAKLIWNIPLFWMLLPAYIVVLILTWFATEEFVNVGWDSAGVTTGPITVPLVLAMGLGVGGQLGVVEGFGILAMASAWPILCVLVMGIFVTHRRKAVLKQSSGESGAAA